MAAFDAVIIGGGHNGLVAAGYLAKAGARVIVLEKRPIVGGACITEEPWPGYRINTFAYVCGLLRPQIVEDLQLTKFGYEPILYDPQYFVPFPDGRSLVLWVDEAKTVEEISRFSKKDAQAYPKYVAFWDEILDLVEPTLMAPPVPIADLFGMFSGPEAENLLRELFLMSAADFLGEWLESEELKAALAAQAVIGRSAVRTARGPPMCSDTTASGSWMAIGRSGDTLEVAWAASRRRCRTPRSTSGPSSGPGSA